MLIVTSKFSGKHYFHFFYLRVDSCETMHPCIHQGRQRSSSILKGGKHHPNRQIEKYLWHELKVYICPKKPKTKQELVDVIKATVTVQKYVSHLRKVIPKVIELEGAATGF